MTDSTQPAETSSEPHQDRMEQRYAIALAGGQDALR